MEKSIQQIYQDFADQMVQIYKDAGARATMAITAAALDILCAGGSVADVSKLNEVANMISEKAMSELKTV